MELTTKHILLFTGGRDFNNYNFVHKSILSFVRERKLCSTEIIGIVGAARGLDKAAELFLIQSTAPVLIIPADWKLLGKQAGPKRNRHMMNTGLALAGALSCPITLLAFPGGTGTQHMINTCISADIEIVHFSPEDGES